MAGERPQQIYSAMWTSPEHLQALGLITANFQLLEHTASTQIGRLLASEYAQIVTAEMSFRAMCALLASLARARLVNGAKLNQLLKIIEAMTRVEQERNAVMHSGWLSGQGGGTLTRWKVTAKQGKGLVEQRVLMTAKDLDAIAKRIAKVSGDLMFFEIEEADLN